MNVTPPKNSQRLMRDYAERINPDLMNKLLHRAVPVLEHVGWEIKNVSPGFTESVLPLNERTTNQHGTHQAALISLSADYTGGMALTTLLTGVPLSGIHKCQPEESASLWLASMNVKYISPSTGHLTGTCRIDEKTTRKIQDRYFQGKRVLVSLPIEFFSNGKRVAQADLKYFAQPTIQLLTCSDKPSALFQQKIKASARMIAGVRASKEPSAKIRVECPHASIAAGPHGQLLAKKLRTALPQLTEMVLARTKHIDETIKKMHGVEQVVMLGAGLDMRPFRFADRSPMIKFFEVDLPDMLIERDRVIEQMDVSNGSPQPVRFSVPSNFLVDDVAEKLRSQPEFVPACKTLFIYEGCSMYFSKEQNVKLLKNVFSIAEHPESQLWCDLVASSVVAQDKSKRPEIKEFLKQMDNMGESFIFGSDQPDEFIQSIGCRSSKSTSCRQYLETSEPIFDVYRFAVGKRN